MHPEYHESWEDFPDEWYEDVGDEIVDCQRLLLQKCFDLPCSQPNTGKD